MEYTISLGWWLAPMIITLIALGWAFAKGDHGAASGYGAIGQGFINAMLFGFAMIVSLVAWLLWALFR